MRTRLVAGMIVFLSAGCGYTDVNRVMLGSPGATRPAEVTVTMEGSPMPKYYTEVAILQAIGHGTHANLEHIVEALRLEAAALGCNAIVKVRVDQGSSQASGTAVAIVIHDEPAVPQTAPQGAAVQGSPTDEGTASPVAPGP
jgi:hypothetical protein